MKKLVIMLAFSVLFMNGVVAKENDEFVYAKFEDGIIVKESIVQINCAGLNRETDGKDDTLMIVTSPYKRCMEYNRGESFHIMADRFMKNRNPHMDFNVRPDYFQVYRTNGLIDSEENGLYRLINENGMELGLVKIKSFLNSVDFVEAYDDIEYHLKHTPLKIISKKAKEFPYSPDVKKFLSTYRTVASN